MILCAGLTPAWQHVVSVDRLDHGGVNRTRKNQWCASGKAVNAAVALTQLGQPCRLLSVIGGPFAPLMEYDLRELQVSRRWVEVGAPTRCCTTIIERDTAMATELAENAAPLHKTELAAFERAYEEEVQGADIVVLTGSLPKGAPASFYADLLTRTPCPAVIDARGEELLCALDRRPLVVKPNRSELAATLGRPLDDQRALHQAIKEVNDRGAQWVVVTDGPHAVHLGGDGAIITLDPPAVASINPIGSGDAFAAGLSAGLRAGKSVPEAVEGGIAAATRNLLNPLPGRLADGHRTS